MLHFIIEADTCNLDSGLHVTLFATIIGGVVYWLWRGSQWLTTRLPARKAAALLGALAAFGYVLLAGFEVPAQRTLYMLIVGAIGLWLGRPGSAPTVLAWALLIVLLLDPWAVLSAGFWLSFGAVALLMYAGIGRLHDRRPHAWFFAATRAQVAITLGMVPLMLALFQQVSLISPIANAFAIPIVSMVVVPLALVWLVAGNLGVFAPATHYPVGSFTRVRVEGFPFYLVHAPGGWYAVGWKWGVLFAGAYKRHCRLRLDRATTQFFSYPFVDQHVGVNCHAQRERNGGNARQG